MEKERDVFAEIDSINQKLDKLTLNLDSHKSPADYLYINDDKIHEMLVCINVLKNGLEKNLQYVTRLEEIISPKNS